MTEAKCNIAAYHICQAKWINNLQSGQRALEGLPWADIAAPLAQAEDGLARLDERLRASPIGEGWRARADFADAAASLWLAGALVDLEDLVLHDAGMDIRAPTHELTRAHAIVRARRRIGLGAADWALSPAGLEALRGRAGAAGLAMGGTGSERVAAPEREQADESVPTLEAEAADAWSSELAAIDALLTGSARRVSQATAQRPAPPDAEEGDEDEKFAQWRKALDQTEGLPPVLAAALALQAWQELAPSKTRPWLGRLLAAALLRARGKTAAHLACLNVGHLNLARVRGGAARSSSGLIHELGAITATAQQGLKDHDRWLQARQQLDRRLQGRRSNSSLPELANYILATPIASASMIARHLGITPRAVPDLVAELGLREATGRGRYRAWGIL